MASTTLDAEAALKAINDLKEEFAQMAQFATSYVTSFTVVKEKSSDIKIVNEIIEVGNAVVADCKDVQENLDEMAVGIRQFKEQLDSWTSEGLGDIED